MSQPVAQSDSKPGLLPIHPGVLFVLVCALYLAFNLIVNEFILTEVVYYRSLGEQLTAERIRDVLALQEQYAWIGYALTPLVLTVKMGYTALCLAVGAVLAGYDALTFTRTFKAALAAEGVFLLAAALRTAWGLWVLDVQTLDDFSTFAPLSILAFFNADTLPQWALYPLQALNVFEFLYCLALGAILSWLWKRDLSRFDDLSALALGAYGTGLLLWIAAATFFLLQVT
jgi:hypothetical protein